jgi:ubiquinone/menaquinone biosynthesis C-methylase UbiE
MLGLSGADRLLDVGSGDGFWTIRFARRCARVVGLEPDTWALRYAKQLHASQKVAYIHGVVERLPFHDCSFDKVVSVSGMEHFTDPLQGLAEMARVLTQGGRIALSVDSLLPENSSSPFREWHRHRHFVTHYFNQDNLLAMMDTVGLNSEPERTVHLFRSRVAARLRQIFIRHPRLWMPVFPLCYAAVRLADTLSNDMHGQIIIVTATRRQF